MPALTCCDVSGVVKLVVPDFNNDGVMYAQMGAAVVPEKPPCQFTRWGMKIRSVCWPKAGEAGHS